MLLPAATEVGDATFVVTRSESVDSATTSVAIAELFAEFGSGVLELTVSISLITVPCVVPGVTFNTTGKLAVPAAKLVLVQVIVPAAPTAGRIQDHPVGTGVSETNVVLGGVLSLKTEFAAALGPEFVTTCV
jgi:hypothetical protein